MCPSSFEAEWEEVEKKMADYTLTDEIRSSPQFYEVGKAMATANLKLIVIRLIFLGDLICRSLFGEKWSLFQVIEVEERNARCPALVAVDMAKGYSQILMSSRLRRYVGWVSGTTVWSPTRLFLGLSWAPAYF